MKSSRDLEIKEMRTVKAKLGATILVVVFCTAAAAGFFAGEAQALPPNEVETYFYSDATYSVEIGWRLLLCNGQRYSSGSTSVYTITYSTP
ncbi:MAG TPA: hypothetical protein VHM02_12120, partial [Thermoanaerobaculia bacterium]|nr:hypothetical protein [Thermoanaerobaculia bacterium]